MSPNRRALEGANSPEPAALEVGDPCALGPGGTIVVLRSLRDDPLAAMHHNRQIDTAQYRAARRWQSAYEAAEIGSVRSLDLSRDRVDGGRTGPPAVDEAQARAMKALARAAAALGMEGEAIVRDVLGARLTLVAAAAKRGLHSEFERRYLGRRFRECLETLACLYGYAMPPR